MNPFGEFLYQLRKEKGMTQSELAQRLDLTNKAISKWETGEAFPETAQLLPLAKIFGVTVDELLRGARCEARVADSPQGETAQVTDGARGKDKTRKAVSGVLCSSVMLLCLSVFFLWSALADAWHVAWVVLPIGAFLCGIVGSALGKKGKRLSGALCAGIMLLGFCLFFGLGLGCDLWHPAWVAIPIAALLCGVIESVLTLVRRKGDDAREPSEPDET